MREKRGFGASDSRDIQDDTDVRCKSHVSGMSYPIPVYQGDIWPVLQLPETFDKSRPFAEIQESRDIGDLDAPDLSGYFYHLELRKFQDDQDRTDQFFLFVIAKIRACHA